MPCLNEMPRLKKLNNSFSDKGLVVIGVNNDEKSDLGKAKKFLKKKDIDYPMLKDTDSSISELFQVSTLPYTIIFKDGKAIERIKGEEDFGNKNILSKFSLYLK